MYLAIDRERMVVTHKHENRETIGNLIHIELGDKAAVSLKANHVDGFKEFSNYELKMLYKNLCGQEFVGYDQQSLALKVIEECSLLPEAKVNELEVGIQAQRVNGKDRYRYIAGTNTPEQDDNFEPIGLVSVVGYVPEPTLNHVPKKRPIATVERSESKSPYISNDHTTTEKAPRQPKEATAPRTAGATKRVWEIAEQCYALHPTIDKELRAAVASACETAGINSSTVSVQYSKWKTTKVS